MKKSIAKRYIIREVRSVLREKELPANSQKKERPDAEDEMSDEMDQNPPSTTIGAPEIEEVQQSLQQAFNQAKALGDDKLNKQIANTITYFMKTHLLGTFGGDE